MNFCIYTSAFNVEKHRFSWREALNSYLNFVGPDGEVVVAVNTSEDESLKLIQAFAADEPNLIVLPTDFSYADPDMDGAIKNAALQATSKEIKIGLDLDEFIPLWQKTLWVGLASQFLASPADAVFVPSVNLYGDFNRVSEVNAKWYMHKAGLFRGTHRGARNPNGTHDIDKSDSCELIYDNGELVNTVRIFPFSGTEASIKALESGEYPYVVHLGYLSLERRVHINRSFWKDHWSVEGGTEADVITELSGLNKKTHEANLAIHPLYG